MALSIKAFNKRLAALRGERESFRQRWISINDHVLPMRGRFLVSDRKRGSRNNDKRVSDAGRKANSTCGAGLMTGLTSPARPWFKTVLFDRALADNDAIRDYTHERDEIARQILAASNVYKCLAELYEDFPAFGVCPLHLDDDDESVIRGTVFAPGEFMLAHDGKGRVRTVAREFEMQVGPLVDEFGLEACSGEVKRLHEQGNVDAWVKVAHVVEPNPDLTPGRADWHGKPFRSVWYETGRTDSDSAVLRVRGYEEWPTPTARWSTSGTDVYATSYPGANALPDLLALQVLEERSLMLVDKATTPPMVGPAALQGQRVAMLPGDITYEPESASGSRLRPAHEVNPQAIDRVAQKIQQHEDRIDRAWYVDLWLMLASDRRAQRPTATEVQETKEEKLLQLGPVTQRVSEEFLGDFLARAFGIMERAGVFPEAPAELDGASYGFEYIGLLPQAQKMLDTARISQGLQEVGILAQLKPSVLDNLNEDEIAQTIFDSLGLKPSLLRSDEQVAQTRSARADAAQRQAATEQGAAMAQGANALAGADTSGKNALTDLVAGLGGPQVGVPGGG